MCVATPSMTSEKQLARRLAWADLSLRSSPALSLEAQSMAQTHVYIYSALVVEKFIPNRTRVTREPNEDTSPCFMWLSNVANEGTVTRTRLWKPNWHSLLLLLRSALHTSLHNKCLVFAQQSPGPSQNPDRQRAPHRELIQACMEIVLSLRKLVLELMNLVLALKKLFEYHIGWDQTGSVFS